MTGWTGEEHGTMAAHTVPLMERYAKRHGAEFACVNLADEVVPPSWMKVPHMGVALGEFDRVLWLDCDVVVLRSDENIFDVPTTPDGAVQSVVEHHTECGHVPNCGVWLVRKPMVPVLQFIWDTRRSDYLHHPWWEQAAMVEQMGYSVYLTNNITRSEVVRSSIIRDNTHFLDPKWNHHPADVNRPDEPNFVHVTMYEDRVDSIRRLCAAAT